MTLHEQGAAIQRDLNDAVFAAVESPSEANLREVSKLINALHTVRESIIRQNQEAAD